LIKKIKRFFGYESKSKRDRSKYWNEDQGWHTCFNCLGNTHEKPEKNCGSFAHHGMYICILEGKVAALEGKVAVLEDEIGIM
jgi:hypothetical protein